MNLEVNGKEYALRLRCREVKKLKEKLQGANILNGITEAMQNSDVETIAKCITVMGGLKDTETYDLIDAYLEDEGNTFFDLCVEIMKVVDEAGFLPKRGMAQQIAEGMQTVLDSMDLNKLMDQEMAKNEKKSA